MTDFVAPANGTIDWRWDHGARRQGIDAGAFMVSAPSAAHSINELTGLICPEKRYEPVTIKFVQLVLDEVLGLALPTRV